MNTLRKAAQPELTTCNCRWDGETQVQQCTLHEAHVAAIHEWAERAKTAEKALAQQGSNNKTALRTLEDLTTWLDGLGDSIHTYSLRGIALAAWDARGKALEQRGELVEYQSFTKPGFMSSSPMSWEPCTPEQYREYLKDGTPTRALYAEATPAPQAQPELICKECRDTGSIYAVSGEGPFDCYACNRKVAPALQAQSLTLDNAPLGTKAPAFNGGHWERVESGWKWSTGATFPRPGDDWTGEFVLPKSTPAPHPETRTVVQQIEPVAGWKLVPIEPTKEMCAAAVKFTNGDAVYKNVAAEALEIEEGIYGEAYRSMLAAAPAAQPVQEDIASDAERLSNALIDQPESLHVRISASAELSLLSKKAEQLLKHQEDSRKVIEQMVGALDWITKYVEATPQTLEQAHAWASISNKAIQAGQHWLKENK